MMNSSAETERSNRADMLKDPYCTKNNEKCPIWLAILGERGFLQSASLEHLM